MSVHLLKVSLGFGAPKLKLSFLYTSYCWRPPLNASEDGGSGWQALH